MTTYAPPPPENTMKCPHCEEEIQVALVRCEHCGSLLGEANWVEEYKELGQNMRFYGNLYVVKPIRTNELVS